MKTMLGWMPILATVGALVSACSYEIVSPVPKNERAEPDLVCRDKPASLPFSTVVLHGENFTPMPSKTLEDKSQLILPKISLQRTQALPGAPNDASGGPDSVSITDDPAHPEESRVHWTSEQVMSFDLQPEDELPTGVFSITVTNPDGKGTTTLEQGIAVLPAPIVSEVKPPTLCDDKTDHTVTINGAYFLSFDGGVPTVSLTPIMPVGEGHTYTPTIDLKDCSALEGNFIEKNVKVCSSLTITLGADDFPVTEPTDFSVVVTNPAPADCASSSMIKITIDPPPRVDTVIPSTVCEGGSQVTIGGKGFLPGAKVSMDCMGSLVAATSATVSEDGTKISASFGPSAAPGDACDVIVENPDGCQDRPLPHKAVTVTTGPILFFVDPPVVYNGINTRMTLFVTTIKPPLPADAVTIVPTGQAMPVTTLTPIPPLPEHPNRVQAILPTTQEAGTYDITFKDSSGCFATLPKALVVTKDVVVTLKSVDSPFGASGDTTAITIFRDAAALPPANQPFVRTPRVFLNPTGAQMTDVAVPVESVSFVDGDTVTGVVPKNTPVNSYDVVLVNPDGSVGFLPAGFRETQKAPPVITGATPASIVAATGQAVILAGSNFAIGDAVTLRCVDVLGKPAAVPNVVSVEPVCAGTACTQQITIDGSGLASGDVCVVRVTNPDESYGEFSAIGVTNSSLNLNSPRAGTDMNVGRRALSAASGNATPAARFAYALGGDSGLSTDVLSSTEFAPVDLFGKMGAWTVQKQALNAPRTLAGAVTVGRYIYLVGGEDGAGPLDTAERALILSPRETPAIEDVDLVLGMAGLDTGEWHYRVSATFAASDTDNPGGESLPSDAFTIKLPAFANKKIAVTLVWKAPVDALGAELQGVSGYRIYRTVKANDASGTEALLQSVTDPAKLTFTDDGTAVPAPEQPLPTGSTGHWFQLPKLGTKRSGLGVAAGDDPATPGKFYVYALLGKSDATTASASYEYLPVTIAPNGRQTVAAAWTAGAQPSASPRWQIGTWVANNAVSSLIKAPDTFIYLGGGLNGNDSKNNVIEAGKIGPGGDLGAISNLPKDFPANSSGYGVCAANGQLFVFGGGNGLPSTGAKSAFFDVADPVGNPPPGLTSNSWNNEGLTMTHGRYLLGSTVQSSFIFLLGGQTDEPSNASKTTELVIW
jgi:hypothetical protein